MPSSSSATNTNTSHGNGGGGGGFSVSSVGLDAEAARDSQARQEAALAALVANFEQGATLQQLKVMHNSHMVTRVWDHCPKF
jgi:hypothetical protein